MPGDDKAAYVEEIGACRNFDQMGLALLWGLCQLWRFGELSIKLFLKEAMPILEFGCPQCQNRSVKTGAPKSERK